MQAILLAAGFGTRLKPYTNLRPKPLFPVLNRPLLHLQLERLFASGFDQIIVNAHHLGEQIKAALAGWPAVRLQDEAEILGTGGSLRQALPNLRPEPVLVANADVYHDVSLKQLYQYHLESGNAVTMALHHQPRFNTVQTEGSRVLHFKGGGGALAFTGLQVVNPEVIARIPQGSFFHIIDLYEELAATGTIGLMRVDGSFWQDMGTPEDYLHLHQALLPLVSQSGQWLIDRSAVIEPEVQLRGWGCVGAGARIGAGAELEDCVVWDGAQIPAQARHHFRILTGNAAIDRADRAASAATALETKL
ncbi:MAG: nucleotidyltransferase family protein [bacterium]|nr:nucleotidyltransferase family protein [bacterium]